MAWWVLVFDGFGFVFVAGSEFGACFVRLLCMLVLRCLAGVVHGQIA